MPRSEADRAGRYGAEHRRIRAALLPSAPGSRCTRCGEEIKRGQAIDLDHNDDGRGYKGWAHASCNRRAGAVKGNAARKHTDGGMSRAW